MPMFESVTTLRHFLVDNFKEEFAPVGDAESFRFGYIVGTNRRLTINSSVQLAEAYSFPMILLGFMFWIIDF